MRSLPVMDRVRIVDETSDEGISENAMRVRFLRAAKRRLAEEPSMMLFVRVTSELFPVHCELRDDTLLVPDGRFLFSPEQAAKITGCTPQALRLYWLRHVAGTHVPGMPIQI